MRFGDKQVLDDVPLVVDPQESFRDWNQESNGPFGAHHLMNMLDEPASLTVEPVRPFEENRGVPRVFSLERRSGWAIACSVSRITVASTATASGTSPAFSPIRSIKSPTNFGLPPRAAANTGPPLSPEYTFALIRNFSRSRGPPGE